MLSAHGKALGFEPNSACIQYTVLILTSDLNFEASAEANADSELNLE